MAVSRKKSREIVFRMLFPLGFEDSGQAELFELASNEETPVGPEREYIDNLYKSAIDNMDEINKVLAEKLEGFTIDRVFKTDLAAIRLGIAEIKYTKTDKKVVLSECVEIAKKYGTDKSGSFVNGVLAKV
ncbi:MAG: transcription antitermination factor NusB [Firmicutes bacterium]|nr:transcription antitermination factor NusB [Bacillota bacterium]